FGASRFFADLPAAVVVLDTTRFLGGKAFLVLGLAGTGQCQRLAAGLGLGCAQPQGRAILLLHGPPLRAAATGRAGPAGAHAGLSTGLGHHAGAFFHDYGRARRPARHPAGAIAQPGAALKGQSLLGASVVGTLVVVISHTSYRLSSCSAGKSTPDAAERSVWSCIAGALYRASLMALSTAD